MLTERRSSLGVYCVGIQIRRRQRSGWYGSGSSAPRHPTMLFLAHG